MACLLLRGPAMSNAAHVRVQEDNRSRRSDLRHRGGKGKRAVLRSVEASESPRPRAPARTAPADRRHASTLAAYLEDVRRHPLMTREEERVIAARFAETGDDRLGARLVTANLRLVVKIALEFRSARRHLSD